jgi:putative ABC transport system permease protein
MLKSFRFYFGYAIRNQRRSLRWTAFAAFCIAAGVAAIVALRTLGLSIGDSLIDNVRANNRGDISLSTTGGGMGFNFTASGGDVDVFQAGTLAAIEQWAAENDARVSAFLETSNLQVTQVDAVTVGRPQFVTGLLIDPATYPAYGTITLLEPAGAILESVFTGGNDVVISRNLADAQGLAVGDTVRVTGTDEPFTVRGIARTEQEAGISDLLASFFGFAYLPIDRAELLQQPTLPNTLAIALPDGSPPDVIDQAAMELQRLAAGEVSTNRTVNELLTSYSAISDILGRFIVIMGLGALLIGGVAIINTMLVLVGRRTNEIAALKTFGLKGRQIMFMFLTEALLLGVVGSVLGAGLGVLLSIGVNQYGAAFLQQPLTWRIYPEAIGFGLAVGIVVTMVFGVLPVLVANRIRPATILRPNESSVPAVGCLQSLLALVLVILVVGIIAGQILGTVIGGIIGVALTLLFLAFLVGVMWIVVWLVSKLPAFGVVDLKLALRNLRARRLRTATTLLALAAGMFALSSITFVGAGTRELLNFQVAQQLGGNVLVFPLISLVSPQLGQAALNTQLNAIEGIDYRTTLSTYGGRLVAVNGQSPDVPDFGVARAERAFQSAPLQARETDNPNVQAPAMAAGRYLTPDDRGEAVIVVGDDLLSASLGITVGSTLTIRVDSVPYDFKVVGQTAGGGFQFGQYEIPPGVISARPDFQLTVLSVNNDNLNQVLLDLSANPTLIALDLTFIDGLLRRVIDQFAAIPTVVGLLSLLAAAVAMANTVALATLERRRQIGVMKAVGLKGRRVMGILLLENTLIGVLGGVLGIGLSAVGVALLTSLNEGQAIPVPADAAPVAVALMIAAVLIAWIATFVSARSVVNEHVSEVLRYE